MRQASVSEALSGLDSIGRIWRNRRLFAGVFLGTIAIALGALLVLPVR
jgi:polysaccharide biosynthesis transport protein